MTEQLKQLALAATQGPWETEVHNDGHAIAWLGNNAIYSSTVSLREYKAPEIDAAYIAAASPDVVLGLIAERDELKLAYAECSRQKNELLTAHKVNARREADDEALMREALEAIERACNTAMINTAKARVPECGDFCSIAQDLDWSCEALRARLGGV